MQGFGPLPEISLRLWNKNFTLDSMMSQYKIKRIGLLYSPALRQ